MTALEDALAIAEQALEPGMRARLEIHLAERLPQHPYRPGLTPRPESGVIFDISDRAGRTLTSPDWRSSEAWTAGFLLLRRGYFWEAHEVLEPVWLALPPNAPERKQVQAVIQTANAALKLEMGLPRAALRLCAIAGALLDDAGSGDAMGLPVQQVRVYLEAVRRKATAGEEK